MAPITPAMRSSVATWSKRQAGRWFWSNSCPVTRRRGSCAARPNRPSEKHRARTRSLTTIWSSAVVAERISVIVATYNRPDALDAVLRSLARQSDTDFDVLVADDGSTAQTKLAVDEWKARFDGRLTHIWHRDDGF